MPAKVSVSGAKPIPEGRVPPAQVKEYVYGWTPPVAAGSAALWKVPTRRLIMLRGGSVSGSAVTSTSTALDTAAAGWELSVTAYVQESRKGVSGVPAKVSVSGAKPIPEGSIPPAQVKECAYGGTPPVAAGSAALWKVPTRRLIMLRGGSVSGSAVTSTSTALDTAAAGWELSVTAYVQESRKGVSGVPAKVRVSGAKPIPEGSIPPAQVKECAYGGTPPVAAGSAALWKVPTRRLIMLRGGSVSGSAVTSTSTALDTAAAGWELSVTAYVQESRKGVSGVPAKVRVSGANPIPEGSIPPAQVKECAYGGTPPVAAGSAPL